VSLVEKNKGPGYKTSKYGISGYLPELTLFDEQSSPDKRGLTTI